VKLILIAPRPRLRYLDDLRNNITGASHPHDVIEMQFLALDLGFIVQRRTLNIRLPNKDPF